MIDPLISLAFSMHNAKGVYALLLGSGVSTGAGIPTGWGIVLDIIRKVATAHNESCEPDPEKWYTAKFGEPPSYSRLLDQLGKTNHERRDFLKPYIEPSGEDREQGRRVPTKAHAAIARLAAAGYIKVILTTNFDRLLESSLEAVGVSPTVIASPDSVAGATPLPHAACTVVKLHGDYLDARIKNTPDELASYDDSLGRYLDRVLDEYGLIVCGWSADWDTALRAAFERCPNRRYTTYWAARGQPSDAAKGLINQRRAELIAIDGADTFFERLAERVFALESIAGPHPLTTAASVALLKRYLPDPQSSIRLHDLVHEQTERLVSFASGEAFNLAAAFSPESVWARTEKYEAGAETLVAMLATGCYWGEQRHIPLWTRVLERVTNGASSHSGFEAYVQLQRYPALLLFLRLGSVPSLASTTKH
jgi:hypothetical protein